MILKRTLSCLSAAAVLGCSVISANAHAFFPAPKLPVVIDNKVQVIIKLAGDPVLASDAAANEGSDFLMTDAGIQMTNALEQEHAVACEDIRVIYPDFESEYSYTSLINGFSGELPESLIPKVEALPEVVSVSRVNRYALPEMYNAADYGGVTAYRESLGGYGEGEVIAVLDSELDVTHPMFAPLDDGKDVSITYDDVVEINRTLGFNVSIDPDMAYRSSKLPFVVNYADVDNPYYTAYSYMYHGTHVCGIAAGNKIEGPDGELSGIAPDAQLVFMDVFNYDDTIGAYCDDAVCAAAMEDAVKLGATVISCSYGMNFEDVESTSYVDAFASAQNAGIVICTAAGNESDNVMSPGTVAPENVDRSTINSPSCDPYVFSVASADNGKLQTGQFYLKGDKNPIQFTGDLCFYFDNGTELEYVDLTDIGNPDDYDWESVAEKVVLLSLGDEDVAMKYMYSLSAGCAGAIVYDSVDESLFDGGTLDVPTAFVTLADGQRLIAASDKKIVTNDTISVIDIPVAVSSFTSYGCTKDLRLKPEIMGIGGNVYSAGYDDTIYSMSGTSMATPYTSGCVALVSEYLKENGIELSGADKVAFVKALMMNSAVPLENDQGTFVTPRRQGAGLVNLRNLTKDKVLITRNGVAKVELGDRLGNNFSFDVDLSNINDQDVDFTTAKVCLTTDGYDVGEGFATLNFIDTPLTYDATVSGYDHIAANSSTVCSVNVSLDPSLMDAYSEVFTNGMFVEGYLLLGGADNCCDISVPILGFYGDWTAVPIYDADRYDDNSVTGTACKVSMYGDSQIILGASLARLCILMDTLNNIEDEADFDYIYEEFRPSIVDALKGDIYISPNGDMMADDLAAYSVLLREAYISDLSVYDSDGNYVMGDNESFYYYPAYQPLYGSVDGDMATLPEGRYSASSFAYINYPSESMTVQDYSFDFTVDNTPPEIDAKMFKENGRTYVQLTANDPAIDGIYVTGYGNGGLKDSYDPADPNPGFPLDTISETINGLKPFEEEGYEEEEYYEESASNSLSGISQSYAMSSFDPLEPQNIEANFLDIIACDTATGTASIVYDVTDLDGFSFTVMDRAYNYTVYAGDAPVVYSIEAPAETPAGEKLHLVAPSIISGTEIIKEGWQISFDGGVTWKDFDPDTIMTADYNGAYLRYYAANEFGYATSNTVRITIGNGQSKTDTNTTPAVYNTTKSTTTTDNPNTGAAAAAAATAVSFAAVVIIGRRREKKK